MAALAALVYVLLHKQQVQPLPFQQTKSYTLACPLFAQPLALFQI